MACHGPLGLQWEMVSAAPALSPPSHVLYCPDVGAVGALLCQAGHVRLLGLPPPPCCDGVYAAVSPLPPYLWRVGGAVCPAASDPCCALFRCCLGGCAAMTVPFRAPAGVFAGVR